jgi:hypothetical protein
MHTKQERVPPLDLELEPSLEHEKELVFVLVAVPVDERPRSRQVERRNHSRS